MRPPVFRLSSLLTCGGLQRVMAGLRQELKGRVVFLPEELGQHELDAAADALALFLGWPVRGVGRVADLGRQEGPALLWLTEPVESAPPAVPGSVVVAVRRSALLGRELSSWSLEMPQELLLLRDGIATCIRHERQEGPLAALPSWIGRVADTPATAVEFVSGVRHHHLQRPDADQAALFCAGLARVVSGMLARLPEDKAAALALWACGAGTPPVAPGLIFESGLLYRGDGQMQKVLRRPLALMGRLEQAPGRPPLRALVASLQGEAWGVYHALSLFLASRPPDSGLGPPRGRVDYVAVSLLYPHMLADPDFYLKTTSPVMVGGAAGSGKTELAVHLVSRLAHRLPVIWTSFGVSPALGWLPVAHELGVSLDEGDGLDEGVPLWVKNAQAALSRRRILLVVDDAPAEGLTPWLPAAAAVAPLILSESPHADGYELDPLGAERSHQLLASDHPFDDAQLAPLIEMVGGHPQALILLKALLARCTPEAVLASLRAQAAQSVEATQASVLRAVLRISTAHLSQPAQRVLTALVVAVPTGSPRAFVPAAAGLTDEEASAALAELEELSLLRHAPDPVGLHGTVRAFWTETIRDAGDDLRDAVRRHCAALLALLPAAKEVSHELYAELIWAARRARELAALDDEEAAADCLALADLLLSFSDWRRRYSLEQAIEADQAAYDQCERLDGVHQEAAAMKLAGALRAYTELLTRAAARPDPPLVG